MSSTKITIVVVGLIGALWLPSTAHAQSVTPERALLNRSAVTAWGATSTFTQGPVIDGKRALLNRSYTISDTPVGSADVTVTESASVDGVRALLNRSSS